MSLTLKFVATLFVVLVAGAFADECNLLCTREYKPVCAVFRAEFPSQCVMNSIACRLHKAGMKLEYSSPGQCPGCNVLCTLDYTPVCGTDGVTYSNECSLRSESCQTGKWIGVATSTACPTSAPEEEEVTTSQADE